MDLGGVACSFAILGRFCWICAGLEGGPGVAGGGPGVALLPTGTSSSYLSVCICVFIHTLIIKSFTKKHNCICVFIHTLIIKSFTKKPSVSEFSFIL